MVDLSGCKTMIDAGGGSGLYSIAFCQKYPELRSTIFDVRETLAVTKEMIADRQEKRQIDLQEGNFLEDPLGNNVDVVLLSDVIYEDLMAKIVLKNAWDSLTMPTLKNQGLCLAHYSRLNSWWIMLREK